MSPTSSVFMLFSQSSADHWSCLARCMSLDRMGQQLDLRTHNPDTVSLKIQQGLQKKIPDRCTGSGHLHWSRFWRIDPYNHSRCRKWHSFEQSQQSSADRWSYLGRCRSLWCMDPQLGLRCHSLGTVSLSIQRGLRRKTPGHCTGLGHFHLSRLGRTCPYNRSRCRMLHTVNEHGQTSILRSVEVGMQWEFLSWVCGFVYIEVRDRKWIIFGIEHSRSWTRTHSQWMANTKWSRNIHLNNKLNSSKTRVSLFSTRVLKYILIWAAFIQIVQKI